jgi:hypothetical protein
MPANPLATPRNEADASFQTDILIFIIAREEQPMPTSNLKQQAHDLIDRLPDNAGWDDVVYEMVTRREIELGLADSEANRTTPVEDIAKEFGLKA